MVCWLGFAAVFLFRRRPAEAAERKRDPQSRIGILIQVVGYTMVWAGQPRLAHLILLNHPLLEIVFAVFTISLAVISVVLVNMAVRTLGKQWALAARIVEGHKLITKGPYRIVRNPIYTGMFGLLIASGPADGHWLRLLIAIVVFFIGTLIRIRSEERLLRETFGTEFDDYARRVKALIPGVY